ncbi:MAG: carboxypeptidase-like regulatory domain-containing protein [Cyclobacteriaceae bacterium]|nr:carboxypeptidase-like regulatory domain-containing protein [Cyclobacteriaceae bacterium]
MAEGLIVDSQTGEPVPFASIALVGTSKGTSSNQYGQFSIAVKDSFALMVTCIGYESKTIQSLDALKRIQLNPMATQLNTIVVSDKPIHPQKIIRKAFTSIHENYSTKPFLQQFFYRHYCKDDSVYGRLIEASVDVWKNKGYRSLQSFAGEREEIRITQLRRSMDKTRMAQGHEPIAISDILETDLAGYQAPEKSERMLFYTRISNLKADLESYTFTFKGITSYDGQEVYEINYSYRDTVPTGTGTYRVRTQANGSLFITTDTYAFIKRDEVKTYGQNTLRTSTFYRKYNNQYYPYHFVLDGKSQAADNSTHIFHIELMSVEIKTNETAKFTGKIPGREELLTIPYDSVFWTSNTILKTTPLEDDIIRDLGGGTSLNKQFYRYRQYEMNTRDGGLNAEEKFHWLQEDSRGNRILYLIFWSDPIKSYLRELELSKQLQQQYRNSIMFVFLSIDDDEIQWQKTVQQYNLFSDGIINYRIGSKSSLLKSLRVKETPSFVIYNRNGEVFDLKAKRPSDPLLQQDLHALLESK